MSRLSKISRNKPESGFISVISLIILLIFAVLGLFYWSISRYSTDMILKEAHRIKARALAHAAVETVMVNIMNQYRMGNFDVSFSPGKFSVSGTDREYNMDFGDGKFSVESVAPYAIGNKSFKDQGYYKNNVLIGNYDIWQIRALAVIPQSGTKARIDTLVKVIRTRTQY
ncbi:MAG: hypothetical protein HQM08_23130 [Candidatus Riflebacteria bacterium]|nr:hypothetical protein [Candidatus Riflebacteria bacterium]